MSDNTDIRNRVEWFCQDHYAGLGIEKLQLVTTLKDRFGDCSDKSVVVTFKDGLQVHLDLTFDGKVAGYYTRTPQPGVLTS